RRIALEARARLARILDDVTDHLAGLAQFAFDAEAARVAHRLLLLDVELDELDGEAMPEEPRDAADRAFLAVEIEQLHVALGGGIKLDDLRNAEARLEFVPDVGTQAVAAGEPDLVVRLLRMRWRVVQIPAQLANVMEDRAVPTCDVIPELACREFLANHQRAAGEEDRTGRHYAADRVIHRQAVVAHVGRLCVHDAGEAVARQHQAVMVD